ncbi:MAG: NnrU family protein [Alphaproteobacteria bacterium]|nr:NnrU family protein [Alphaproteobacteria bacterium]
MTQLWFSLAVFIGLHLAVAAGPMRRALVAKTGVAAYIAGYSILSVAVLWWVGDAYRAADVAILWDLDPWMRWVPALAMPVSFILLAAALTNPNPLSVGVKGGRFDPARPGIVGVTRHPLMWALTLWAVTHIPPNGDTAGVTLFGLFALLGLSGPFSLDFKKRRELGAARWAELARGTSSVPFAAVLTGRARLAASFPGWTPIVAGLALYAAVIAWGHEALVGVSPLP